MQNRKVYVNEGITPLGELLCYQKIQKIFLVTGKESYKKIENVITSFFTKYQVFKFNDFEANPKYPDIMFGIQKYKEFKPDVVVAVGGGSCIDIAKSINFLADQIESPLKIIKGKAANISSSKIPLIALPTTSGTGSEATSFSVVYIGKEKYSLSHPDILPDYVVSDFSLVSSIPKYIAACSSFDALTQALESFWSRNATSESDVYALKSIDLIINNIEKSINNPSKETLKGMVEGAFFSGKAINITKTTVPHALSYILTSQFSVPHGHAVATFFSPTLELTYDLAEEETKQKIERIFDFFNVNNKHSFKKEWVSLMEKCHLKDGISQYDIKNTHIKMIVSNVNIQRLSGHPVAFSEKNLYEIVEKLFL